VEAFDGLIDWLTAHGFSSGIVVIGIIGAIAFHVNNKWSVDAETRLKAIESKLRIERKPQVNEKSPWPFLLVWFVVAVYLLGKSLQTGGILTLGGIALSGFMLLLFALSACYHIAKAVRKKRKRQQWLNKIFSKAD